MLIEKDIIKILGQLAGNEQIHVAFDGSDILIRFLEDASKLSLSTIVYSGGNYIPTSVRNCLSHKSTSFDHEIKTFLSINEELFKVSLNYLGQSDRLSHLQLKELLEEFGLIAEKWRNHLDENDRNDLVYVHVK
ncbi:MAG: hypothetical protein H0W88_03570 [Parachlamydiaceae bacterium]|nr:hypothetical protein [Parachlamydiaceae bacterium]